MAQTRWASSYTVEYKLHDAKKSVHVTNFISECTVEYRQSAPPIFTLGWQERGGGADKR